MITTGPAPELVEWFGWYLGLALALQGGGLPPRPRGLAGDTGDLPHLRPPSANERADAPRDSPINALKRSSSEKAAGSDRRARASTAYRACWASASVVGSGSWGFAETHRRPPAAVILQRPSRLMRDAARP